MPERSKGGHLRCLDLYLMGSNPIHAMAQWTSSSLAGGSFTRFSSKSSGRFESYTESAPVAQSAEHWSYEPKVTVSCCLQVFCSFITSLGFEPRREHCYSPVFFLLWCNGSTADFESANSRSIRGGRIPLPKGVYTVRFRAEVL